MYIMCIDVYMCVYVYMYICVHMAGCQNYVLLRLRGFPVHIAKRCANRIYIYIYIYGAYAGAHPCVNDSFFAKTNIKPIKSL